MKKKGTTTDIERRTERRRQQLKDRQDYRQTLIYRREQIEGKIAAVEGQIKTLRGPE